MAYDEKLANRIRELVAAEADQVEEKLMFGGMCFMVNDKMCVTTRDDRIMVRVSPEQYEVEIHGDGCSPMIHGGREMKGFVFVSAEVLRRKGELERWVNMALAFNRASPAPKKAARKTMAKKSPPRKK